MYPSKFFLIIFSFLFLLVQPARAIVDPLAVPNNRFGIHVLESEDLLPAADLVNTRGGDWGYVTLVIRQNDRDLDKWQPIFDQLRRLHLIPIVRLATYSQNNSWVKPDLQDVDAWVSFLNSLNWVIQNRYLILFNEPNHALEWGNTINPQEYAAIVRQLRDKLKSASPDFFILPAGFDTAVPDSSTSMSAVNYWRRMYQADPTIFTLFDGWNSHSYPNPGFSGSPFAVGFGTLQSYLTEFNYLKSFGLKSDLPVFISETGWIHSDSASDALSDFYTQSFTKVWTQPNLVAITPFILNYSQPPFSQFSWQIPNSQDFYPHYHQVAALAKISGRPVQTHNSQLLADNFPESLVDNSQYQFYLKLENTGQSIWNSADFSLSVTGNFPPAMIQVEPLSTTEPSTTAEVKISLTTPPTHGSYLLSLQLNFKGEPFGEKFEQTITVVPPPTVIVKVKLLFKRSASADDFNLLVYDADNQLQTKLLLEIKAGQSRPIPLYNLIPNNFYRFVILKPFYLPRQIISQLDSDQTEIIFKSMLPFDLNQDQSLSLADLFFWLRLF